MPRDAPAHMLPVFRPKVAPRSCPIQASLGTLGRKWALSILRDIAFYRRVRFSDILRANEGLTPRVLSHRLRDLRDAELVRRVRGERPREFTYELTEKGRDAVPVLTALMDFGYRHHADEVFGDGCARTVSEVLPGEQKKLMGGLLKYARAGARARKAS